MASSRTMHLSKKNLCASEVPFMTNELHSAVTKRPKYRYKFFKNKNQTNKKNYKVQKNFWEKLFQETKKSYFDSLNTKKSQIVELSGKLLLVFSEKQLQKVKKCFLMKQKNIVLMIKKKKKCKTCNNIFSNVVSDSKISDHCKLFFTKKHTFSLNHVAK